MLMTRTAGERPHKILAEYKAAGHLVALSLLHLGQVKLVDAWFLVGIFLGDDLGKLKYEDIKGLDEALAAAMKPWYDFGFLTGAVSPPLTDPIHGLFIETFRATVSSTCIFSLYSYSLSHCYSSLLIVLLMGELNWLRNASP